LTYRGDHNGNKQRNTDEAQRRELKRGDIARLEASAWNTGEKKTEKVWLIPRPMMSSSMRHAGWNLTMVTNNSTINTRPASCRVMEKKGEPKMDERREREREREREKEREREREREKERERDRETDRMSTG
jgi:hypothetical protein